MSWDPIWEALFRTQEWGRYPPEELIRFVARNFFRAPERGQVKILEVGCGMGANIWFLKREGFDTYGIDGSSSAIARAAQRLAEEGWSAHLQVGDIINLDALYPAQSFDAVIDVGCLQCNRLDAIETIVERIGTVLKPGGRVFSLVAASGSWGEGTGRELEPGTYTDIPEGPLHQRGVNHFFTLDEVQRLFARFDEVSIEYSVRSMDQRQHEYKNWVIQGMKPA